MRDDAWVDATRRPVPSLVDVAYEAIAEAIFDQRLVADERITIDRIARDLEMSITPVREAMSRAAADGLILQVRNRGYAVAPGLSRVTYHKLFEVRRLIEVHAAQVADVRAIDTAELEARHRAMAELRPSPDYGVYRAFSRLDHEFHLSFVQRAANVFLTGAWSGLHFHLHMSRLYSGQGVVDYRQAVAEHAAIIAALRRADREATVDAVTAHIDSAKTRLVELLPAEDSPSTDETADVLP